MIQSCLIIMFIRLNMDNNDVEECIQLGFSEIRNSKVLSGVFNYDTL